MVLTAAQPVAPAASADISGAPVTAAWLTKRRPIGDAENPGGAGRGEEMLALLRAVGTPRPRYDRGLAGGLRAWLEDAAWTVTSSRGEAEPPLLLGPRRLLGTSPGSWRLDRTDPPDQESSDANRMTRRLVHALFRHLVTTGSIAAPLPEALDALAASGADDIVERVDALPPGARAALGDSLVVHSRHLGALVPRFAPSWLPRTDDRIAIPLAGGRVVLRGVFDLLVGTPRPDSASLCALGLSIDGPWVRARRTLHYLALLELLRSGTPPFRLAMLHSATGQFVVEDVNEDHLASMAAHIVAWLVGGEDASG
jgi:hypothetical protein